MRFHKSPVVAGVKHAYSRLGYTLGIDFSNAVFSRPSSSGCVFLVDWFFFLQKIVNAVSPFPNASPECMHERKKNQFTINTLELGLRLLCFHRYLVRF